jgi:hypothetical protein
MAANKRTPDNYIFVIAARDSEGAGKLIKKLSELKSMFKGVL